MLLNNPVVSNDNAMNDPEFDVLKLLMTQSLKFRLEETTDMISSSEVVLLKEMCVIFISDKKLSIKLG